MANKKKNLELIKNSFLHESEEITHAIFGAYETKSLGNDTVKNGVLAATEERIIFCAKRLSGYDSEIFHYNKISTFELSKKLMGNIVTFYSSGNKVSIKWINDDELDNFIEYVNKKIDGKEKDTQNVLESEHNTSNDDLESFKKIKMLKELLDIGAITQDEFETKKKQLLNL
ncbi:PH domain-containing protein [Staphylococcus pettenkoferi]|uniref:PH domain-containing protein n=1 Tax=Staphylococcus pettenkoferi TaxID=170573 RepID=UPI00227597C6|nr:PH domain-containing protein [Staphylococcus pettenkoferi]MCY1565530.1 PH domain-containing protein [Staphylococcus pettenkoferi]MCY1589892.1 PH domain-containing protein [Staphylococcus pettenkoferi]MCY1599282.1 PH domain-containing protein [Staphylococcus pettenkoferi]MCY1602872.1 PH domain-containing protein [Staphylococcus pettenkoferi]MCY1613744.1 PH domain-containing protein [Staphylococcus pettenkoferi]